MQFTQKFRRAAALIAAGVTVTASLASCSVVDSYLGDGQDNKASSVPMAESVAQALKTPVTPENKAAAKQALGMVDQIGDIAQEGTNADYDRANFPHWERVSTLIQKYPQAKQDWAGQLKGLPGGCTSREVMLIRQSSTRATYDKYCKVTSGSWINTYGLWDDNAGTVVGLGDVIQDKSKVDGDHVIPLAGAHRLGASQWSLENRTRFANDPLNIIIDDGPANRQKGDRLVDSWVPYNPDAACSYMVRYVKLSVKYNLPGTKSIKDGLRTDLNRCVTETAPQFMELGD